MAQRPAPGRRACLLGLGASAALVLAPRLALAQTGTAAAEAAQAAREGPLHEGSLRAGRLRDGLLRELTGPEQRIRALGVMRDGQSLFEYHRAGLARDEAHDVRSVTKSVVSLLVGAALAQRRMATSDAPLSDLLPQAADATLQAQVRALRLNHCLSMSTGFEPMSSAETGDYSRFLEHFHDPHGTARALRRPLRHEPGSRWHYSNMDSQLAGLALMHAIGAGASGQTPGAALLAWARDSLLGPLGAGDARWSGNSAGEPNFAAGLHLRLRDLLALGQLVLDQGRWQGRALVDASYLAQATTAHIDTPHPLRGGFIRYGWLWWCAPTPEGSLPATYAVGFGGQYLYVVPGRRIVVAALSEATDEQQQRGSARTGRVLREWALPLAWS